MEPERLRRIEELFHGALERDPAGREAFLTEACAGDEALRREVESLLELEPQAERFIETPARELAVRALAAEPPPPARQAGERVGPYELVALLGSGGAGQVYVAHDPRLGRKVALKLLLDPFADEPGRLRRFEQEARAASALNHPNILTVYETGEAGGTSYLAAELVEGCTLRERLAAGPMPPAEALDVAVQIARALAAAHAAGIVHRDIKPENVMLRPDGLVKVLDFGLAKRAPPPSGLAGRGTRSGLSALSALTAPGVVLGTARYMSPEQAQGQPVDARTDLFSLGVVLYEMLAGAPPFDGATTSDVLAALLYRQPEPLTAGSRPIPPRLEQLVDGLLEKERARRGPDVAALLRELEAVRRGLEPDRAAASSAAAAGAGPPAAGIRPEAPASGALPPRQRRALPWRAGAAALLLLALVAVLAPRVWQPAWLAPSMLEPAGPGASSLQRVQRLCRQGREAADRGTEPGLHQALACFARAAALASDHAPAQAGLAVCHALLSRFEGASLPEAAARARAAAQRALELDPRLAEAHAARGLLLKDHERDLPGAELELRRAIELDAAYGPAHLWLAELLVAADRLDEAQAAARRAGRRRPRSAAAVAQAGWVLYRARRHEEARAQLLRAIELDPALARPRFLLGQVAESMQGLDEAAAAARQAVELSGGDALALASLGHVLAYAGDRARAHALLDELEARARRRPVPPVALALLHTGLGQRDSAFERLEAAAAQRDPLLRLWLGDPQLDPLRADPRFAGLLERLERPAGSR